MSTVGIDLQGVAIRYQQAGLSVLPIRADGSKAPALKEWKQFQQRLPTEEEVRQWFGNGLRGVGVVCGQVSGGLYALDLDDLQIGEDYITELIGALGETFWAMPECRTPRPGKRLFFRYDGELSNTVLAWCVDAEGKRHEAIALLGEGKYCIVPPTPAECHPNRKPYEWVRGDLTSVPTLTAEQLEDVLALARLFNEEQPKPEPVRVTGRVGDRYNAEADVLDLLQMHGWRLAGNGRGGNVHLTRPGKGRGVSASWHEELRTFYVFSTNAPPFETGRAYSPFACYALLECNGDFAEAARRLAEQYGVQHGVPQPAPRRAMSLRELMAKQFEPLTYLVPDILPEGGMTLLVGRPKVGKSWLALQIACALSAGGFALGLDTPLPKRRVLYFALEDGERRLQRRITLLGTPYDPDAFFVQFALSPLDRGGAEELRDLIRDTGAQVVFVDVVARILPKRRRNDGVYQSDYDAFALLKDLAVAEGITLIAVHHESKAPNEDPLMRVSGSTGLTGAVDAVLTLSKPRGETMGTLFVTGRDVEKEGEYALSFSAGRWYLEGDAKEVRMSEERKAILQAVEALGGKATPKMIADYLQKNASTTRNLLAKMKAAGELLWDGTHYSINTVDSVDSVDSTTPASTPVDTVDSVDSTTSTSTPVDTVDSVDSTPSTPSTPSTLSTPSTPSTPFTLFEDGNQHATTTTAANDDGVLVTPSCGGVFGWCEACQKATLHRLTREGTLECSECKRAEPAFGG